jgi:hypothetical protein
MAHCKHSIRPYCCAAFLAIAHRSSRLQGAAQGGAGLRTLLRRLGHCAPVVQRQWWMRADNT